MEEVGASEHFPVAWERLGAAAGIVFSILFFAGAIIGAAGTDRKPSDTSDSIANLLIDVRDRYNVGSYLMLLGIFAFLWFLGYLRTVLHRAEGPGGWLTLTAFGGGLAGAAALLVLISYTLASAVVTDYGNDAVVAKTLFILGWAHLATAFPGLAALVGATSALTLRHRVLPVWTAWLGFAITLVLLTPLGFFGYLAFFLWTIVIAIALIVKTGRVRPDQAERVLPSQLS